MRIRDTRSTAVTADDPPCSYARERNCFVQLSGDNPRPLIVDRVHARSDTRHFVAADDGRIEEVDDAERARGAIPLLKIEQLSS